MSIIRRIKNILRGLEQRWGSSRLKRQLWDKEYATGKWDHCGDTPDALVYSYVEKHCANGRVLDLGCGFGNTGYELKDSKYSQYVGVDISHVAVEKARVRNNLNGRSLKNQYVQGDIVTYVPQHEFDVIMFRESIYYVPVSKIVSMLERYSKCLTASGVLLVNVSTNGTKKAPKFLDLIERNFVVSDKHVSPSGEDFIIVFKSKAQVTAGIRPAHV
jgi:SAM-dependent methyltransferase